MITPPLEFANAHIALPTAVRSPRPRLNSVQGPSPSSMRLRMCCHSTFRPQCLAVHCSNAGLHLRSRSTDQHQTAAAGLGRTEAVCNGRQKGARIADRQDSLEIHGRIQHRRSRPFSGDAVSIVSVHVYLVTRFSATSRSDSARSMVRSPASATNSRRRSSTIRAEQAADAVVSNACSGGPGRPRRDGRA